MIETMGRLSKGKAILKWYTW